MIKQVLEADLSHALSHSSAVVLLGNPILGLSWEGFVIETILTHLSSKWSYSYYRTSAQAEIDLVLEGPRRQRIAIEIKRSMTPKITKGFHLASEDINATRKVVIHSGGETFPMAGEIDAMGLLSFLESLGV